MLPDNFASLTQEEKIDARLADWVSTEGKPFASPEVAELYRQRAQRYADVMRLRQPDRVPTTTVTGDLQQHFMGVTPADFFYDYPKAVAAAIGFYEKYPLVE
ncbi:MAG TPA: hypothetical protein VIH37_04520, partial [Candidatus Limnocylindrales bacterium]